MNKHFKTASLGILALFVSCTQKETFCAYHSFPQSEWAPADTVRFEVPISDHSTLNDIYIEVRNNNDYPFRNLWLFVDYGNPDGQTRSDTIHVELADIYGKWYGKGISLYHYSFPYELNVQYPDTGKYVYSIRQGMRENPLKGISDVGLKISRKGAIE
ncbi:MAG: gliding motility lipoprotein GldH [Dysgonamonadaceae bacterium]|jgi:gliding motility-associated lipoprotein GldH|nr:gliding motility lipoprotein GldH [Dysgonamonadaceae bacterium]